MEHLIAKRNGLFSFSVLIFVLRFVVLTTTFFQYHPHQQQQPTTLASASEAESQAEKLMQNAIRTDAKGNLNIPSDMPTEHQKMVQDKYIEFMKQRKNEKKKKEEQQKQSYPKPPEGMSPRKLGMVRDPNTATVVLTKQASIPGGIFWFGSQLEDAPANIRDGASPRIPVKVAPFVIDMDVVSNEQFQDFIASTGYKTEAELFGWSFVLDSLASEEVVAEVDGETGYGRVKSATHWLAAKSATWMTPHGVDSTIEASLNDPVVHVSFKDAEEYCAWALRRLPTEIEWEYAARGGLVNETYPWGSYPSPKRMNVWDGKFPEENTLLDGYHGLAPVNSYKPQNAYGLYNVLGNVWEWVETPPPKKRGRANQKQKRQKVKENTEKVLRGGSFVDSLDGSFNHIVIVSTRQTNAADSAAVNIGFRCAGDRPYVGDDGSKTSEL